MRVLAFQFVLEHWEFFAAATAAGLAAWGVLRLFTSIAAARRAKEEEARSRELDSEMAKIRATLRS
jgi:hypothetical protein